MARTGFFKPVHVKSLWAHAVRSLIIARKKLVGQRVTLENQICGLAVIFGIRLPGALTAAFIDNALKASEGIVGLSSAMRGLILIGARSAVMTSVAGDRCGHQAHDKSLGGLPPADDDPGLDQLTPLAFAAAIDDPSRIVDRETSRRISPGMSTSKRGDRRVRTLLYEAANVMLTRYKGQLKLKDWALTIAQRSTIRKARVARARGLGIIMHAMLRDGTEFEPV